MKPKDQLAVIARALGFVPEHRFHPVRRWRFDWAIPGLMIAIEYAGHGHTGKTGHIGGHASIQGMTGDAEKSNQAAILGWHVLTFTALHFDAGKRAKHKLTSPLETIEALIHSNPAPQKP